MLFRKRSATSPKQGASSPSLVLEGNTIDADAVRAGLSAIGLSQVERFQAADWFEPSLSSERDFVPVIVLDAALGVGEEDRFHAHLVRFLDLRSPIIFVGNMDQIDFEQDQFDLVEEEFSVLLSSLGLSPLGVFPLPLDQPDLMPWWSPSNPSPLFQKTCMSGSSTSKSPPLRVQVISSISEGDRWIIEGNILSGTVEPGDKVLSSPSNQSAILRGISGISESGVGSKVARLSFETPFFVETGDLLSHVDNSPVETDVFRVKAHWTGASRQVGDEVQLTTAYWKATGTIQSVESVLNLIDRTIIQDQSPTAGALVELVIRADQLLALDTAETAPEAGWITLTGLNVEDTNLCRGHISMEGYADQRQLLTPKATNTTPIRHVVSDEARTRRNGHEGGVLWFTGLSGSGKSTLAVALEARLFEKGYQVFVLDGDNVRQGLTSNLGFSPDDRSENIRRVGEVAALFRQAGTIVISSFISPYRSDRDRARHAAHSSFHEVHIKAGVETCIARDPKGLYRRALKGDIRDFTGISAPYEAPVHPELTIDTEMLSIDACVEQLVNYVDRNFRV